MPALITEGINSEIPWPYASALSTAQICVPGPTSDFSCARLCSNAVCEISSHALEFGAVAAIGAVEVVEVVHDVGEHPHTVTKRNVAVSPH